MDRQALIPHRVEQEWKDVDERDVGRKRGGDARRPGGKEVREPISGSSSVGTDQSTASSGPWSDNRMIVAPSSDRTIAFAVSVRSQSMQLVCCRKAAATAFDLATEAVGKPRR